MQCAIPSVMKTLLTLSGRAKNISVSAAAAPTVTYTLDGEQKNAQTRLINLIMHLQDLHHKYKNATAALINIRAALIL